MAKQITIQHVDPNFVAIIAAILMGADHIASGGGVLGGDEDHWVLSARDLMFEAEKQMVDVVGRS